jgi:hypothetical protein
LRSAVAATVVAAGLEASPAVAREASLAAEREASPAVELLVPAARPMAVRVASLPQVEFTAAVLLDTTAVPSIAGTADTGMATVTAGITAAPSI